MLFKIHGRLFINGKKLLDAKKEVKEKTGKYHTLDWFDIIHKDIIILDEIPKIINELIKENHTLKITEKLENYYISPNDFIYPQMLNETAITKIEISLTPVRLICAGCGNLFYPIRKDQLYCSTREQSLASKR